MLQPDTAAIILRPYQQQAVSKLSRGIAGRCPRLLLQMPTGSGKTETAIGLILELLRQNPNARFIWLTHRRELIRQTAQRLQQAGVNTFAGYSANWRTDQSLPAHTAIVASPGVLKRRDILDQLDHNWHLTVDEAHHAPAAVWSDLIIRFPGSVIGLTATPWRLSRREGFDHLFDRLILGPQVSELIAAGYLANPLVMAGKSETRIRGGPIGAGGDYTPAGIAAANDDRVLTQAAVDWWQDSTGGELQTIFYAISVAHAYRLHQALTDAGVSAAVVTQQTAEAERDKATQSFREGRFRCLANVAIYTEGADFPEAECIVLLRPTESLPLYLQMVGRGMRPGARGHVLILDATDNTHRHGLPTQDREWSLAPRGETGEGETPVKECSSCHAMLPAATQVCPQCGKEFGRKCHRCGIWRGWHQWKSHNPVCDRCTREQTFDHREDVAPTLDDGWSVSSKGNPIIKTPTRRATLYHLAEPEHGYVIYLNDGDGSRRIRLSEASERQAKLRAEDELNLRTVMVKRRIKNCFQIITAACQTMDNVQRSRMLNEASVFASTIRTEIDTLLQQSARKNMNRYYDELVAAGTAARMMEPPAAPPCQD